MLESLVVTILNKFLSDFIENLDSDQLNISLFSGDVQLENLTVRRTILDNMPLPFKLHYGRVGSIKVDVPVTAITSQPLKIDIQDIFVVLKIKGLDDWKEKIEVDAYQNGIASSLDSAEQRYLNSEAMKKKDPGYFAKLLSRVIDNVQIKIKNLYIRLEDTLSYPDTPWAMGLVLGELDICTNNAQWKPEFVAGEQLTRKSLKIHDFAVFLNYGSQDEVLFSNFRNLLHYPNPELAFLRMECGFDPDKPESLLKNNYIIN